jgi:biotin carboxylase
VRKAGVRAVKQRLCRTLDEVVSFLTTLPGGGVDSARNVPLKCVVKPVQSAGSDDVFLCNNQSDAVEAFQKINGETSGVVSM